MISLEIHFMQPVQYIFCPPSKAMKSEECVANKGTLMCKMIILCRSSIYSYLCFTTEAAHYLKKIRLQFIVLFSDYNKICKRQTYLLPVAIYFQGLNGFKSVCRTSDNGSTLENKLFHFRVKLSIEVSSCVEKQLE